MFLIVIFGKKIFNYKKEENLEENEKYMKKYLEVCEKDYKYVSDDDILVSI